MLFQLAQTHRLAAGVFLEHAAKLSCLFSVLLKNGQKSTPRFGISMRPGNGIALRAEVGLYPKCNRKL